MQYIVTFLYLPKNFEYKPPSPSPVYKPIKILTQKWFRI